jgi:uncharacterized protein (DUF736 family)
MSKTKRVGAAWKRQFDGKTFLSVVITNPTGPDYQYTIWPVKEKRSENSPDYDVTMKADERPNYSAPKPHAAQDDFPADTTPDDDVPF